MSAASGFFPYDSDFNNITSSYQSIYTTSVTCPYPVFSAYQWAGYYVTVYNETAGYQTVKSTNGAINPYELRVDSSITLGPGEPFWIHENFNSNNPILINNFTQLQFLANMTDASYVSPYAELNATIDCLGYNFNPISNYNNATFDGNGYTLSNFYTSSAASDYRGLFGTTSDTTISNFTMDNMSIEGDAYVGLVGYGIDVVLEDIIITDSTLTATNTAGPLFGMLRGDSEVTRCSAEAATAIDTATYSLSGGLGGYIRDNTVISQSLSTGNITAATGDRTGGLVGTAADTTSILNSYSRVNVSGDASVCGLVGKSDNTVTYLNTYASGELTGASVYGLVDFAGTGNAPGSYWDVNTTGVATSDGGIDKTTIEMYQESTFTGWDFTNVWQLEGYPVLSFESLDYSLNPTIVYPVNGTTLDSNYPDLTEVNFVWSGHGGTDSSSYQLARDSNYNTIVSSGTTTVNYKTLSLSADDYYFRVKYNFDDSTESDWVESQFTINTTATDYGTAIQGVVYKLAGGSQSALSGVKVTAYNATYGSFDTTTGENGFYLFTDGIDVGQWQLIASKDGYETSSVNFIDVTTGNTSTRDILLEEENAPNYILPHYVRFIPKYLYLITYDDLLVTVYEGDSATEFASDVTGSDGAVSFKLIQTTKYRITVVNEARGIDDTHYITPKDEEYVLPIGISDDRYDHNEALNKITYSITQANVNLSIGTITVSYTHLTLPTN